MSSAPEVRTDRIALTELQLRATEIMLYRAADSIDRLLRIPPQYTKVAVAPQIGGPHG